MGLTDDMTGLVQRLVEPLRGWFVPWIDRPWIAPTLLNGWVDYGGLSAPAGYHKDALGYVHLRGDIKSGTTTPFTTLFTLPVGYRPAFVINAATVSNSAFGWIVVLTNGNVQITAGSSVFLSLAIPPFLAEQ